MWELLPQEFEVRGARLEHRRKKYGPPSRASSGSGAQGTQGGGHDPLNLVGTGEEEGGDFQSMEMGIAPTQVNISDATKKGSGYSGGTNIPGNTKMGGSAQGNIGIFGHGSTSILPVAATTSSNIAAAQGGLTLISGPPPPIFPHMLVSQGVTTPGVAFPVSTGFIPPSAPAGVVSQPGQTGSSIQNSKDFQSGTENPDEMEGGKYPSLW